MIERRQPAWGVQRSTQRRDADEGNCYRDCLKVFLSIGLIA
ncbi:hypothetical protein SAMN06265222_101830 [Neorhodopirellula lusitana]|uniref:Uncharacterized protein n=1 Tax=Neorhodopirellula lusitana TaxID=445327 RepID=A0ABY1PTF3_9BACT|nr:hypothetical protein SAMN06265222_101830 [Neorhodopirellula lusitana]